MYWAPITSEFILNIKIIGSLQIFYKFFGSILTAADMYVTKNLDNILQLWQLHLTYFRHCFNPASLFTNNKEFNVINNFIYALKSHFVVFFMIKYFFNYLDK